MADYVDVSKLSITQIDQMMFFNNANQLEFIFDEIQEGNIQNGEEKSEITGKNGRKIGNLKKNKTVTFTATNGLIVGGALAAQTGSDVEQGTFKVRTTEIVAVNSNKATIEGTPVGTTGAELGYVYIKNQNGSQGKAYEQAAAAAKDKFSFTGKEITFNDGDITDGTEIIVIYDTEVTSAKISNDTTKYSKVLKAYVDVTAQDNCDNVYHGQFIIPRADFSGEFELAMGGDPSTHAIEFESLAGGCGNSNTLWDFIVFQ